MQNIDKTEHDTNNENTNNKQTKWENEEGHKELRKQKDANNDKAENNDTKTGIEKKALKNG